MLLLLQVEESLFLWFFFVLVLVRIIFLDPDLTDSVAEWFDFVDWSMLDSMFWRIRLVLAGSRGIRQESVRE